MEDGHFVSFDYSLRYTEGFQLFVSIDYQAIFLIFFFSDDENHFDF
jgi:hypothetical protein